VASRILVVDDEPMVRALLVRGLTDDGHDVVAVSDGRAALDVVRQTDGGFDLIVTNTWMPGLSGAELIDRLRQDFPTIPILHIDDVTRRSGAEKSAADVPTLFKPFSIAALRQAVRDLLADGGSG
jgi:CheY-like chemotaxis protein